MANYQMNVFENILGANINTQTNSANFLWFHRVYIPGSISFNNVIMMLSASGTTAKTATISFGLYSLNVSTLSLQNSASQTTNPGANTLDWITFATSAAENITPGEWWFAVASSTAGNNRMSLMMAMTPSSSYSSVSAAGPFFRGRYSVTSAAFPAAICTSNMIDEGSTNNQNQIRHPYVIITS